MIRRRYHHELTLLRLRIAFAIQEDAKGTADAMLAAQDFAGSDHLLVLNADNYYSSNAFRQLAQLNGNGLAGFERQALVLQGNIDPERIKRFALLRVGHDGVLEDLVEKPEEAAFADFGEHALVSMNLWSFSPEIFEACRRIPLSSRGEYELPEAVRHGVTGREFMQRDNAMQNLNVAAQLAPWPTPNSGAAERHGSELAGAAGAVQVEGVQRQWIWADVKHGSNAGSMGDAGRSGSQGFDGPGNMELHGGEGPIRSTAEAGVPDPWADLIWLPCSDGKARPTESTVQRMDDGLSASLGYLCDGDRYLLSPLIQGAKNRTGRLRAYGNAIVSPLAAEFIMAYMDISR